MKLEKEDYIDPACPLCGKPGETESARPVPVDRIQGKLREYEDASDWEGAERHLKYWLAEEGMTMLVVTHEMDFARNVSNQVLFMDGGKVIERGPSKEFFAAPKEERSREFIRAIRESRE